MFFTRCVGGRLLSLSLLAPGLLLGGSASAAGRREESSSGQVRNAEARTSAQSSSDVQPASGSSPVNTPAPAQPEHAATPVTPEDNGPQVTTTSSVHVSGPVTPTYNADNPFESHGQIPHFDLGGTFGYNNPGGFYGLETDYRFTEWSSFGVAGGQGLWGFRLTPSARVYPFGASNIGLFLEGGVSLNFGSTATFNTTLNGVETQQVVRQNFIPAANLSVGLRRQFLTYFWSAVKLGYQWNLRKDAYTVEDGSSLNDVSRGLMDFSQPGGLIFGVSAGVAFL